MNGSVMRYIVFLREKAIKQSKENGLPAEDSMFWSTANFLEQLNNENVDTKILLQKAEDNTGFDGTDFAHPAWWRGFDAAVAAIVPRLTLILTGADDGRGVAAGESWEVLRRTLIEARAHGVGLSSAVTYVRALHAMSVLCGFSLAYDGAARVVPYNQALEEQLHNDIFGEDA